MRERKASTRHAMQHSIRLELDLRAPPSGLVSQLCAGFRANQPNSILRDGARRVCPLAVRTVKLPVLIHARDEEAGSSAPHRQSSPIVRCNEVVPTPDTLLGLSPAQRDLAKDSLSVVLHQRVGRQNPNAATPDGERSCRCGIRESQLLDRVAERGSGPTRAVWSCCGRRRRRSSRCMRGCARCGRARQPRIGVTCSATQREAAKEDDLDCARHARIVA